MNKKHSKLHQLIIPSFAKKKQGGSVLIEQDDSDDSSGESTGGTSRGGATGRGKRKYVDSYLVEETTHMERERRLAEQHGHRKLARVHAREHHEQEQQPAPEGELQNSIMQHPKLDNQRFDGIDTNLNPEPPLNTEARREYDNERRNQEMEKQLRLGNMPKFTTAPKPQMG